MKVKGYPQFERAVKSIIKANKTVCRPQQCHGEPVILSLPKDEPSPGSPKPDKKERHPEPAEGSQPVINQSTFHCYVIGDIFRISTGAKVQDFDFSNFKSEEEICNYISKAIELLRQHIPQQQTLFDDYTETISLLR